MSILYTPQVFIKKAHEVHKNLYDYSLVDYVRANQKVIIRCPIHREFKQTPSSHLFGRGCPKCGRIKTITKNSRKLEEFICSAKKAHGDRYDYSKITMYSGCHVKIDIQCKEHGLFKQSPEKHLYGQGCPKCAIELKKYNQDTTEGFINKAIKIYGNRYDYSLVEYKKSSIKVKISCRKHGIFEITPNNHLRGNGCYECGLEKNAVRRRSNTQEFITKARNVHGDLYDYFLVEYSSVFKKIKIRCPEHGLFLQAPYAHLYGRGCPRCQESRGERKIALYLDTMGIEYIRQKTFKQCRNKRPLPFDFYIPNIKTCIEFDGRQHFFPSNYFGGIEAFEYLKKSDAIKNIFCFNNNIRLIRISYNMKKDEIISILNKLK